MPLFSSSVILCMDFSLINARKGSPFVPLSAVRLFFLCPPHNPNTTFFLHNYPSIHVNTRTSLHSPALCPSNPSYRTTRPVSALNVIPHSMRYPVALLVASVSMPLHNNALSISLGSQHPPQTSFRSNAESSCQDDSDDNIQLPSHNNAVSISLCFQHPPQTSFRRNAESSCKAHSDDNTQSPHSNAVSISLGFHHPPQTSFRSNAESSCKDDSDDNTQLPSHNNAVSTSLGFHHPFFTSSTFFYNPIALLFNLPLNH